MGPLQTLSVLPPNFLTIQTVRSQTAVQRGAPSNEYQWLGPRCGTNNRLRHFAPPLL